VVLLQAAISRKGPGFACKEMVDAGRVTLFVSPDGLAEITEVLNRPELRKKFKALTPEKAEAFLRDLAARAIAVTEVPKTPACWTFVQNAATSCLQSRSGE
jgi:predicted nucleic acid-binding protein